MPQIIQQRIVAILKAHGFDGVILEDAVITSVECVHLESGVHFEEYSSLRTIEETRNLLGY